MPSNYLIQPKGPIDTIIFDLDDTLVNWDLQSITWPEYLAPMLTSVVRFLGEKGHDVDAGKFGRKFGRNVRDAWADARATKTWEAVHMSGVAQKTLSDFKIDPATISIRELLESFEWYPMPGVGPFPDTHEVLDTLRAQGYKLGLITNAYQPMWMRDVEMEAFGLIDRLDARITSGDTGFMKPHPAIYWRMLGMLNSTPDRAIFVGDSPRNDIAGANATGLVSVQIAPPHLDKRPQIPEEHADHIITTLSEIFPLLSKLSAS